MGLESVDNEEAVESVPIHDTYITGVHRLEFLSRHTVRIILYVDENGTRIVKEKLLMEVDSIPAAIAFVMKATWHRLTHIPLMEVAMANRVGRH